MRRNHGFTLVELLVYTAIFAIVAGLLTTIFYAVINTQKKTSVSGEVSQQLNLVLTTVQRLVGDSSLVEAVYEGNNPSSPCATFCTLKLRREDPAKDPTVISSNATGIYLQEGVSPQVTLTTNKVLINHFRLTKQEIPGGHAVVEISTSFSYNTTNPTFAVTKAIESAIARVNAATFDADLIPNQDNTFDIGQIGANLRWKNGRFSGDVTVAGNVGIGTASPATSALLDLTSTAKGLLPPRMTTAQRDAIGSLTAGLFIYNTTTNEFNLYNGTSWGAVGGVGWAASSTNIYNTNSGNVGIGLVNPQSALALGSDAGTAASGIKFGSTGDTNLY
ncbi:MAG: type II secretion system protein, partial [Candidatus Colwellbacteria bacterium]